MKKKIIFLMLSTVLCAAVFAQNASDFKTDGKGTITGYNGVVKKVLIPSQIEGVTITAIGDKAFAEKELISVTIPNSVTIIGDNAFDKNNLTSVTIPDSVKNIGYYAFSENQLISITIGSGVELRESSFLYSFIYYYLMNDKGKTFYEAYDEGGKKAGTYTRPDTEWSSKWTRQTTLVQNASGFKTNGKGTITDYTGKETVIVIPSKIGNETITAIGDWAFYNNKLTSVTIPNSVEYIGVYAFAGNFDSEYNPTEDGNRLTSVIIPDSVITIGGYAFYSNKLTSVNIPDNVLSIGVGAFENNKLTSVTIGNIRFISTDAFSKNDNLKTLYLGTDIDILSSSFSIYTYYDYMCNNRKAGNYDNTVNYSVKTEGDYEFVRTKYGTVITSYNGNEENVVIPSKIGNDTITFIEDWAFCNKNLTSVTIPDNVTSIGVAAFKGNYELTNVTIGNSVTFIRREAFMATSLTSVTIGANVEIEPDDYYGYSSLSGLEDTYINGGKQAGTYTIDAESNKWTKQASLSQNSGDFITNGNGIITNYNGNDTVVVIPSKIGSETITSIGATAFFSKKITSVTIPDTVTFIGIMAFADNLLTSVTIPNSVTTIEGLAFRDNQLTSVTMGNRVTSIGERAFYNNLLSSVVLSNSITNIGRMAFSNNKLTSISIPNKVTFIGVGAFENNPLTSVSIGAYVNVSNSNGFDDAYNKSNKRAGIYTRPNAESETWTRK